MNVSSLDNGRGRRIIVELGGVEHQWTVEFATEFRDALTRELSEQATPALTDREAMVWAAAFVHALASGERSHVAARDAARAVLALRDPETLELVDPSGLDRSYRDMLLAMTGGGR